MKMKRKYPIQLQIYKFTLLFCFFILVSCQTRPEVPIQASHQRENSPETLLKPYVLMILIDGYRYDYNPLFKPKNLLAFQRSSSGAKALIPVFPSKTFPNHYSIMTGLYSDHHEIVSNYFKNPFTDKIFKVGERDSSKNNEWYRGDPLWFIAEKNGIKTACYFWVSCEIIKSGIRPSYFESYSNLPQSKERVQKVLSWLQLPETVRPHFLTLYFSSLDSAAHRFGVQSPEVKLAIEDIDNALGELFIGLEQLKLPINVMILSDHGMQDVEKEKIIFIDKELDLSNFDIFGSGPLMQLYLKKGISKLEIQKLIGSWKKGVNEKRVNYKLFRREEIPNHYHYSHTEKVGDLIIEAQSPYSLELAKDSLLSGNSIKGDHGYHPSNSQMWGIFYLKGPSIKEGVLLEPIENIHLYPLVLKLFQIPSESAIDGDIKKVQVLLKREFDDKY